MKVSSIIDEFTKWSVIGDELYVFHPQHHGKILFIRNSTVVQLWQIALDSVNVDVFSRNVKRTMESLSENEVESLIAKFFTLFSNYLKKRVGDEGL